MNDIIQVNADESKLISHFGSDQSFQWLMERQAEIYQVPMADVSRFADVRGALIKATQMSWTYGVMPGKHIYLIPFNKKDGNSWRQTYAVADSYEWRKASADEKAQENGWRYMVQTEQMSAEDVRAYVSDNKLAGPYAEQDRGFRSRVLLMHEIEITKLMGVDYNPPWHYGFWRKNAELKQEKWKSDNVPSGRTPDWVAMKRAEKSALAQHFELRPLGGWARKSEAQRRAVIEDHITSVLPEPQQSARGAKALMANPVYDADFYESDVPVSHPPIEDDDAEIEEATPVVGKCPECSAPTGRPHASKCSKRAVAVPA